MGRAGEHDALFKFWLATKTEDVTLQCTGVFIIKFSIKNTVTGTCLGGRNVTCEFIQMY